ncbi:16448_t:CDS:2, partial [Acaulospora morrowiae]
QKLGEYFQTVYINKDALDNFMILLEVIQSSDCKLYVCIDEYNAFINKALKNETFLQPLIAYNNSSVQSKVKKIDSLFKQFYSLLKYALLIEEFWDLYGFKKSEVEFFLDKAFGNSLSDNIKEEIISWLKEKNDGEFITETLKIYDWKKEDLMPVRKCLQILEAEHNIESFCRFIEKTLLKPLKNNSVKYSNEEELKQVFIDTLILTLHTDIEPKFQVYSQSSNLGGKAINLVKTSIGKRIVIEFDNIKIENIKLNNTRDNWQEATKVS